MSAFVVESVFKAKDKVSSVFKRMAGNSKFFGTEADKAFDKASRKAKKFKGITKGILKADVIRGGFNLLKRGIFEAGREFVDFDQTIGRAAAKFPEKIDRGSAAFDRLNKAARDVGATTEFTAAEAAEGLDFLAMAGFSAEQAIAALPGIVDLATAANLDLAAASDIASDALGLLGLNSDDAAVQAENLARINDVLAATATSANTTVEQMFEALKAGGATATDAGADIEQYSALLGIMAGAGKKGEQAGTALRNMYLRLQAPVGNARGLIKKYAGDVTDANGDLLDMSVIVGRLSESTKGLGGAQRAQIMDTIFGKKAIEAANIVMAAGADEIQKFEGSLRDVTGTSKEMAGKIRQGLGAQLKTLKSAAIDLGFRFLEAFQEDGKDGIEALIEAIRNFDVKPIVAMMKDVLSVVKAVGSFVIDNWPLVKGIFIAIAAIKFASFIGGIGSMVTSFGGALASSSGLLANVKGISAAGKGLGAVGKGLGAVGAVAGAAGVGYAAGTAINEAVFAPANEAAEKQRLSFDEALRTAKEAARYGTTKEQAQAMVDLKAAAVGLKDELGTTEFAAGTIASLFTDLESPADMLRRRMEEAGTATALLRDAIVATANAPRVAPNQGNAAGSNVEVGGTIRVETAEGLRGDLITEPGQSSPVNIEMAGDQ